MIRKCLKVIGTVAAILVGVVAVYVIYLFTTYHRIADNLPLTVEQPAKKGTDVDALAIGTEYTALTYNIGFGAYTPDFSFFMDGGESSWAKSKESVLDTVQGAGDLVASLRPDFALIEEIDLDSTRSYHTDEYALLKECLPEDYTVFAQNYDSAFLFYPLNQPHGSSKSGLGLFPDIRLRKHCAGAFRFLRHGRNFWIWTAATASPECRWRMERNWSFSRFICRLTETAMRFARRRFPCCVKIWKRSMRRAIMFCAAGILIMI